MKSARALATKATASVVYDRSTLEHALESSRSHPEFAFIRALVTGSVRLWPRYEWMLKQLLQKPLAKKEKVLYCLLINGCCEVLDMTTPDYATVNETVKAAMALKRLWARGLVNGVLRTLERDKDRLGVAILKQPAFVQLGYPQWLAASLVSDWGDRAESLLTDANSQAPLTLRLRSPGAREQYSCSLKAENIEFAFTEASPLGITIQSKTEVHDLPGYHEGEFYVQDESPQLLAQLIEMADGARVLDGCAAPGGKTSLLLEQFPTIELVAVEPSRSRCERLRENLKRLKLSAQVCEADLRQLEDWWDERHFNCVILDVPCSGTGVIRRHPEIKRHRTLEQIAELECLQRELLEAAWSVLAPGGTLLYLTCSVLKRENDHQMQWFLSRHSDAHQQPIELPQGIRTEYGWQQLIERDRGDGFYYAKLVKRQS